MQKKNILEMTNSNINKSMNKCVYLGIPLNTTDFHN